MMRIIAQLESVEKTDMGGLGVNPPRWLQTLILVARRSYIQPAVIIGSVLWLAFGMLRPRPRSKSQKPAGIVAYELLGQALRGTALVFLITDGQWLNAAALGYAVLLSLARLLARGQLRHLLLHQINAVSFFTLMVTATAKILPLIVKDACRPEPKSLASVISLLISLFIAAMTPREWIAPEYPGDVKPSKEETCSWLDYYCTFGRANHLIRKGWKSDISMGELDYLPWGFTPEILHSRIVALRKTYKTTARTLFMLLWQDLCYSVAFASLCLAAECIMPFGLYCLLEHLRRPDEAVFQPYLWLLVMFAGPLIETISQQQFALRSYQAAIKLKIALTAEIYQRVMDSRELEADFLGTPGSSDSQKSSTGQLTNLISSDIKGIMDARSLLMIAVGGPIGASIAFAGLYTIVGWPCLVGFAIMAGASPFSAWITSYANSQQGAWSAAQDSRISIASEYLRSIRVIKYFGWEDTIVKLLTNARAKEMQYLWRIQLLYTAVGQTAYVFPTFALLAIFGLFIGVEKQPLTAAVAYTTINLFELIRDNLAMMAQSSMFVTRVMVSLGRLDKFFASTSLRDEYQQGPLRLEGATFRRNKTAEFYLENLSIDFVQGLNVVTGPSGSGKTTLLLAILGETINEGGHVTRPRDVAYASQSPWLQSQTIRNNILFYSPFDTSRYETVVKACCLEADLKELPDGDRTEVGENGSALSGGQRARVALARALYTHSSLLLLDDIFSAIDTNTALLLWNRVFCTDLLRNRTVVLVTQLTWLPTEADLAITLNGGRVESVEQNIGLIRNPRAIESDDKTDSVRTKLTNRAVGLQNATATAATNTGETEVDQEVALTSFSSRLSVLKYMLYFGGPVAAFLTITSLVVQHGIVLGANYWMSRWVNTVDRETGHDTAYYLGIFVALSLTSAYAESVVFLIFMRGSWVAAKRLHWELISAVFNTSLAWFKDNAIGRVVNRLSGDMTGLDQNITGALMEFLDQVVKGVLLLGAVTSVLPIFLAPAAVLSVLGTVLGEVYSRAAVFLKRLVSSSHSPVVSQISESLDGLAVIRARSDGSHTFGYTLNRMLYASCQASIAQVECNQWLKIRMTGLAALINVSAGLLALSRQGSISAGLVGFSLSQASGLSSSILRLVFGINDLNVEMQAFHRVSEYCRLAPEESATEISAYSDDVERSVPHDWPRSGRVEFRNATIRYTPDGPDILKEITLTFNAGERVAIVGRTGSGKSTLVLSLLRFTHIVSGQILYDGVDITAIPRKQLRQAVATIPQEALLFQGTTSSNLDPTGTIPVPQLQRVLDRCASIPAMQVHAGDVTGSGSHDPFDGRLTLSTPVNAGGNNFSHGQRQVLSLCRILVRRSKLMLLDEATSNMDSETDTEIQRILRVDLNDAEGKERCLITVAHRLGTILDYDRVVVMGSGRVLEEGSPRTLMGRKGDFYDMIMDGGEQSRFDDL